MANEVLYIFFKKTHQVIIFCKFFPIVGDSAELTNYPVCIFEIFLPPPPLEYLDTLSHWYLCFLKQIKIE